MRLIGNIIWLVFGGLFLALGYVVAGVINCIFIITIPFGIASFRLAGYALWPFGRVVVDRGKGSGSGIRLIGNIIWLVFGGLWLALGHLLAALLCAITIHRIRSQSHICGSRGSRSCRWASKSCRSREARRSGETAAVGVALAPTHGD